MTPFLAAGITILFFPAIFLTGIIGVWLIEQFFGLGE
jgi:hypothetical protein